MPRCKAAAQGCNENHAKHMCIFCVEDDADHTFSTCDVRHEAFLYHGTLVSDEEGFNVMKAILGDADPNNPSPSKVVMPSPFSQRKFPNIKMKQSTGGCLGPGFYFTHQWETASAIGKFRAPPNTPWLVLKFQVDLGRMEVKGTESDQMGRWAQQGYDSCSRIHAPWAGIEKNFLEFCVRDEKRIRFLGVTVVWPESIGREIDWVDDMPPFGNMKFTVYAKEGRMKLIFRGSDSLFKIRRRDDWERLRALTGVSRPVPSVINIPEHMTLFRAIEECEIEVVRAMLDGGEDPNQRERENGYFPLYEAARNRRVDVVVVLLNRGADVHATDKHGNTLLHHAASCRCVELLEEVLNRGGEGDTHKQNERGETPLHCAASSGCLHSTQCLVDRGAHTDVNTGDKKGETPFHQACARDTDVALLLFEKGGNVRARDVEGNTPLHHAVKSGNIDRGADDTIRMLIDGGADVNAKNNAGHTPLHIAVEKPEHSDRGLDTEKCRLLLDKGADMHAQDAEGNTPLHCAARLGIVDHNVRFLVQRGANVNAVNTAGAAPLSVAWSEKTKKILEKRGGR